MAKITPKRTTLLQKLAYILRPFVVYMLVKTAVMLFLAIAIPSLPITGIAAWVERSAHQLSAVVNGVASLAAAAFLINDFLIEASTTGEVDIDKGIPGQIVSFMKADFLGKRTVHKAVSLLLCMMLGIAASLALNILIELVETALSGTGKNVLDSEKYETVEMIQYSVSTGLGVVLYGVISPVVEEIVFRGVIYSRIKKFYSVPKAVIFSALLFGVFHANLPQFLYGTVMGALMAVCYEYCGCFAAPLLMHMAVNLFVFLMSVASMFTGGLIAPAWGIIFTVLSAVLLFFIAKYSDRYSDS